jgi:peroxiredoxin (alkyl hydroperoxide reductase subunit C)
MKKGIIFTIALSIAACLAWSQGRNTPRIPLIGEDAPSFTAESTNGQITFPDNFGMKWKILFSHPADFTPVCSSEVLELANMQNDFAKLGVKIAVLSTDTLHVHYSWKKSLESLSYKGRAPVKINFPIIDDNSWYASKKYGMLHPQVSDRRDVRGVFIIDPKNKIRAIYFYPNELGRDMNEIKRAVVALQTADKQKVLIPANWRPGDDVLIPYVKSFDQTEKIETGQHKDTYMAAWYMMFKKLDGGMASGNATDEDTSGKTTETQGDGNAAGATEPNDDGN